MKNLIVALLMVLSFGACTKQDTVIPFGQQVADRIQAEIKKTAASGSIVYVGTTFTNDPSPITFDGEFMIIGTNRYNLNRLIKYEVVYTQGQTIPFLRFYF